MPIKNGLFCAILLLLAASSFAQNMSNRYLFIEGTANRQDHLDFFKSNFAMEAASLGYMVTQSRNQAPHTLSFSVVPDYSDPYYEQHLLTISLYRNQDGAQLVSFDFLFADIDEMYSYTRFLFLNATTSIPLLTEDKNEWKNKWLYVRASFDYPIVFYLLQPTGLIGGAGLYKSGPPGTMDISSPLDHIIRPMPGATLGVEGQFFNFLSLEVNFQLSMGDTRDNYFVNTALGLELKGLVKFQHIMLVPYGAFIYTLNVSPIFSEFPPCVIGGGVQFCARAGKRGSIFIDAKYMYSLGSDAVMRNPWLDFSEKPDQRYPEPAVIHYKRSHIGIGIGYKFGIIDRR
jgi:hypothetical protein